MVWGQPTHAYQQGPAGLVHLVPCDRSTANGRGSWNHFVYHVPVYHWILHAHHFGADLDGGDVLHSPRANHSVRHGYHDEPSADLFDDCSGRSGFVGGSIDQTLLVNMESPAGAPASSGFIRS